MTEDTLPKQGVAGTRGVVQGITVVAECSEMHSPQT